jgi:hypothetical protein
MSSLYEGLNPSTGRLLPAMHSHSAVGTRRSPHVYKQVMTASDRFAPSQSATRPGCSSARCRMQKMTAGNFHRSPPVFGAAAWQVARIVTVCDPRRDRSPRATMRVSRLLHQGVGTTAGDAALTQADGSRRRESFDINVVGFDDLTPRRDFRAHQLGEVIGRHGCGVITQLAHHRDAVRRL